MKSNLFKKFPELIFLLKVVLLYCLFNYGSKFWIGITAKGNYYNAFCDNYLNYIVWLRLSILKASALICSLLGYDVVIIATTNIHFVNGYGVNMVYSCIGIGILSSWAAFAIAYPTKIKRKIIWLFGGIMAIWFINVLRIVFLLLLINKTKNLNGFSFHHELFNAVAYGLVIIMIYFYLKGDKKKELT